MTPELVVQLARRSFEATLLLDDRAFSAMLKELQQSYIQQGKQLQLTEWRKRSWLQRMLENIFYLFSPLL